MGEDIKLFFIILFYVVSAVSFVAWRAIVDRNKKKAEEKDLVARFLRDQFPDSVTISEVAEYTGFNYLSSLDLLCELVKDKRVQEQEGGICFISTELGNKHYPPKLRLVKCD